MSENQLPWVGHKKDTDKFDFDNHTLANCKCGYHKNKLNKNLKLNTIAEIKYHTPYEEYIPRKYSFIIKWLNYLYSLKPKQLHNYNYLFKILYNWFIPTPGNYKVLADELKMRNSMGQTVTVKKGVMIHVKGYNTDADNNTFILIKYKNDVYEITKNDYFYFKYRTEKKD
jgi:hypothetical protein